MKLKFKLDEILKDRGISPRQFAAESGIREGTLYDILNNKIKRVPVDVMVKVHSELGIAPGDWIVIDEE